ncbi:hypothetical protein BKA64DRAFT_738411 [Cadophora sp. MPI-SDFR-AT-0126]|nr:hypothetical protein BKA64DRAFT_738411 [Leotiomycetes sp. MPI-SDFR-AT-0126]
MAHASGNREHLDPVRYTRTGIQATNIATLSGCLTNSTRKPRRYRGSKYPWYLSCWQPLRGWEDAKLQDPLNLMSINFPNQRNVTLGSFKIDNADQITSLQLPKLVQIAGGLDIDLRGGPAIDLSFPSLQGAAYIHLEGNINSVKLPSLRWAMRINVTSTGNLNCTDFAVKVVNATPSYILSAPSDYKSAVACISKTENITAHRSTGMSGSSGLVVQCGNFLLVILSVWLVLAI